MPNIAHQKIKQPSYSFSRTPPPPPASLNQKKSSSLTSTMAEGFAFGTGTSLAKELVSSMYQKSVSNTNYSYCENLKTQLSECIIENHICYNLSELYKQHCVVNEKI